MLLEMDAYMLFLLELNSRENKLIFSRLWIWK